MKVTAKQVFALIDLVKRMRSAQRRYYSHKIDQHLREAKDLERRVDALLNEIQHGQIEGLFDSLQAQAAEATS